ncbi:beta-lactamase family protein [Formosa sp. S-31]
MDFVDAKKFPGAVTLIAKNGKIIYESEVGWSDSLRRTPYRKNHLFRLASMTKPIVSVAIMQLVESGKIQLDDPVYKYIPSFKDTGIITSYKPEDTTWTSSPANTPITIHHLLTHTSGITYGEKLDLVWGSTDFSAIYLKLGRVPAANTCESGKTLEESMDKLGRAPITFEPGTQWQYGLNTDVLGRVVEVASGIQLNDYIRENITNPLEIEKLDFYFPDSLSQDLVKPYLTTPDGTFIEWKTRFEHLKPDYPVQKEQYYFSGGSGMTGTARDYYLFCQAMLNNGNLRNVKLLKPETAQLMHINQIDTVSFPWWPAKFGYGFAVSKGHSVFPDGTYTWGGAFGTEFWIDPKNDLIVIQLRQVFDSPYNNNMNTRLKEIIYGALIKN